MKHLANMAMLGVLSSIPVAVHAEKSCQPVEGQLVEVRSIEALPSGVRGALGASQSGLDGIADRGQSFNKTDVVDSTLPMRRFSIGGVSEDCVLVAIERGGRGYWIEVLVFERTSDAWKAKGLASLESPPGTLSELTSSANK
jgi:hypothetical protein